ncbi:MAG: FAD-dependent oxidoreductase [Synechococcus sp.]|nr:FAD-dependent oxidoreductase [Synechococcus sp.]
MAPGASPQITVIGAGLAGCLAALALRERGAAVQLLAPVADLAATGLSYGSLQGITAARRWRRLEARHGPLGWRPSAVVLHRLGAGPPAAAPAGDRGGRVGPGPWLPLLPAPLPFSRVDTSILMAALPRLLRAAGCTWLEQRVHRLEAMGGGRWYLQLEDGSGLETDRLLLAAGAGCRQLWPSLPPQLGSSWAGVLVQNRLQGRCRWLTALRRGWLVFPTHLRRIDLERVSTPPPGPRWCVDVSLAPWGRGALLGQIIWLDGGEPAGPSRPGEPGSVAAANAAGPAAAGALPPGPRAPGLEAPEPPVHPGPPDPVLQERRLRQALGQLHPDLADLEAEYRQVPVSYSSDGVPVTGQVAPGLWVLAGCSNAFSRLPALAEQLAAAMLATAD